MQTNFRPEQLVEPAMQASEKILRTCVHCGFCTATCPTYLLLGDELDSPRGRIYLIKDMLESGKPATPEVVKHIDRCLSCLSCMTTCPSGVHYMHLVDHARAYIEQTYERPWHDRLVRRVLAFVLPNRARFRMAIAAAWFGKPLKPVIAMVPAIGQRLAAMLDLAPSTLPPRSATERANTFAAAGPRRARVALLTGCALPVLAPSINEATVRLLNRHGVEVVIAGEQCCGALVHHMGRDDQSHAQARAAIDRWTAEIEHGGLDAILVTTSGCGTTIKDYGFMFRDDPAYADKAAKVSALAKDVSEYLITLDLKPTRATGQVVAYHSACSLQHGQKVTDEPKRLLRAMGFAVRDVPEAHICCGSAGTYNILQPEIAGQLRERKVANITRLKPDLIAAGNIGCLTQIAKGTDIPLVHTAELMDWATGGPLPAGLHGHIADGEPVLVAAE
jgi:glycolate oxidase iron-sulfur subunit